MKKVLITGGNGYVAKSLHFSLNNLCEVFIVSRNDFDLTDSFQTMKYFSDKHFDVVLHCAIDGGSRLKQDDFQVMDNNLKMYYNLLECRVKFDRFINFGSGAELYDYGSPYGLSKRVIYNSVKEKENFYNIRIFGLFDENEKDSRFIKTNIVRYLNNQSLYLFNDKEMDFFYMKDFTRLVKHYIFSDKDNLPKTHDCTYNKTFRTIDILQMINNLEEKKLSIIVEGSDSTKYCGEFIDLGIDYVGLEKGIKNTYNILKNKHD